MPDTVPHTTTADATAHAPRRRHRVRQLQDVRAARPPVLGVGERVEHR